VAIYSSEFQRSALATLEARANMMTSGGGAKEPSQLMKSITGMVSWAIIGASYGGWVGAIIGASIGLALSFF